MKYTLPVLVLISGCCELDLSLIETNETYDASTDASTLSDAAPVDSFTEIADSSVPDSFVSYDASLPDAEPVHSFSSFYLLGDSIPVYNGGQGFALSAAGLESSSYPGLFTSNCIGGRQLHYYFESQERYDTLISSIVVKNPSEFYFAMGYNDNAAGRTPEQIGQELLKLTNDIKQALPNVSVFCQTIHVEGGTITAVSQAIRSNCNGTVIEGGNFGIMAQDKLDSIHLNLSGHVKLAEGVRNSVGW